MIDPTITLGYMCCGSRSFEGQGSLSPVKSSVDIRVMDNKLGVCYNPFNNILSMVITWTSNCTLCTLEDKRKRLEQYFLIHYFQNFISVNPITFTNLVDTMQW